MTTLMQLVMGLIANLGLKKTAPKEPLRVMMEYDERGCPRKYTPSPRTMEERRAVIGCFFLSSVCACALEDPSASQANVTQGFVVFSKDRAYAL